MAKMLFCWLGGLERGGGRGRGEGGGRGGGGVGKRREK